MLLSLAVALSAIGVIVFGVLMVAQSVFNQLMIEAGSPAQTAHSSGSAFRHS